MIDQSAKEMAVRVRFAKKQIDIRITRPRIVLRVRHHPGAQRIGLDVAQDRPQVIVALDGRTLEPALPDMAHGAMALMVTPRLGDRQ
jgi:hypothetical protein